MEEEGAGEGEGEEGTEVEEQEEEERMSTSPRSCLRFSLSFLSYWKEGGRKEGREGGGEALTIVIVSTHASSSFSK